MTSGQVPGLAVHAANGELLQVPAVRHTAFALACVVPLQAAPHQAGWF
jgi:hypothetical protein